MLLLQLIPRKVVEDGYEFFAKRHLVTLFSAPNYCGEFDNAGAMMSVDESLLCSFQVRAVPLNRPFLTHPGTVDFKASREKTQIPVQRQRRFDAAQAEEACRLSARPFVFERVGAVVFVLWIDRTLARVCTIYCCFIVVFIWFSLLEDMHSGLLAV
jgi:hypothetical protein